MVSSRVYPGLERKPGGPDNWVEAAGGLPDYIERIAKHLHYEQGFTISRAIATAVNTVKRWARGGTVTEHGTTKRVSAKTQALAVKALAEWEAKKKVGRAANFSDTGAGARSAPYATLDLMDLQALADRANLVADPEQRAIARKAVLDLAVPASKLTADKRKGYASKGTSLPDGSFPVFDKTSLSSAIKLAKTPAQRAHIKSRAKSLGLMSMIPESWGTSDLSDAVLAEVIELASTIPPRNARGRATDGRRSFKQQGKWKHGHIPLNQAAKEAKAKGSPIAMKRMKRLFGADKAPDDPKTSTSKVAAPSTPATPPSVEKGSGPPSGPKHKGEKAAVGRAGMRSGGARKKNAKRVKIDEKSHPGSESAKDVGQLHRTPFTSDVAANSKGKSLPGSQKEASKSTRIPERARQNWDEIPETLKTVRNGKKYVVAEFGGKQYVTEWLGGVNTSDSTKLSKRKVMRTLTTADADAMSQQALRDMMNNPQTPESLKLTLRQALRKKAKEAAK